MDCKCKETLQKTVDLINEMQPDATMREVASILTECIDEHALIELIEKGQVVWTGPDARKLRDNYETSKYHNGDKGFPI